MSPPVLRRFLEAKLSLPAGFQQPSLGKGLEETIQENLGFALLIALDVLAGPIDERAQEFLTAFGHRSPRAREGPFLAEVCRRYKPPMLLPLPLWILSSPS
jgi:hypothetical protein